MIKYKGFPYFLIECKCSFLHRTIWKFVHEMWSNIFEKCCAIILQQIFSSFFTKRTHFGHLKIMKTPFGNIVCHSKMHPCARYGEYDFFGHSKMYNFLFLFLNFNAHFKMWSKRRAWPFIASGWILKKVCFLCD